MKSFHNNLYKNLVLIFIAVLICIIPFYMCSGESLDGTDDKAIEMIENLNPDYQPWASNLYSPDGATENLLFLLQIVLGASFLLFYFIWKSRKARMR